MVSFIKGDNLLDRARILGGEKKFLVRSNFLMLGKFSIKAEIKKSTFSFFILLLERLTEEREWLLFDKNLEKIKKPSSPILFLERLSEWSVLFSYFERKKWIPFAPNPQSSSDSSSS